MVAQTAGDAERDHRLADARELFPYQNERKDMFIFPSICCRELESCEQVKF